jgi:hypothetical protein
MKNRTNPTLRNIDILNQVIFSSFMPFVPRHDNARNTNESNFVHRMDVNNPVVLLKFRRILSITLIVIFHS